MSSNFDNLEHSAIAAIFPWCKTRCTSSLNVVIPLLNAKIIFAMVGSDNNEVGESLHDLSFDYETMPHCRRAQGFQNNNHGFSRQGECDSINSDLVFNRYPSTWVNRSERQQSMYLADVRFDA